MVGITRRIDDLGRVHIPKAVRMKINNGNLNMEDMPFNVKVIKYKGELGVLLTPYDENGSREEE